MYKSVLLLAILITALTLKPSEVGVNDWAIKTIGEIRDLSFSKNKIYFLSYLNSIGILDKNSGEI